METVNDRLAYSQLISFGKYQLSIGKSRLYLHCLLLVFNIIETDQNQMKPTQRAKPTNTNLSQVLYTSNIKFLQSDKVMTSLHLSTATFCQ